MHFRADLSSPPTNVLPLRRRLVAQVCVTLFACVAAMGLSSKTAEGQDIPRYGQNPINVVAGSQTAGSDGEDGIPATSASYGVYTLVTDAAGNMYFTDGGGKVRMVYVGGPVPPLLQAALTYNATLPSYMMSPTVATIGDVYSIVNVGTGIQCVGGDCGDGGPAAAARITFAVGLVFDSKGNLYVADQGDGTSTGSASVRKISVTNDSTNGYISTVAGDSMHMNEGYSGEGTALGAYLNGPNFLAIDSADNLYIADTGNNLIRRVDTSAATPTITTVAGNNTMPGVVCSDNVCGENGPATAALLGGASGVAVNSVGDIFIAESNTNVVRKVDHMMPHNINTIAGQIGVACQDTTCGGEGVPATSATLYYPTSVHLDVNGEPIITDSGDSSVRGVDSTGNIYTLAGVLTQSPTGSEQPNGTPASAATFVYPTDALVDPNRNLLIADNFALLWEVTAPPPLPPQTITFNQIPNTTYGAASFDLTRYATSSSGLTLTFTCAGPVSCTGANNATLTITGAGTVTVTANQAGDATHAPAATAMSTFVVAKAALMVKANNVSFEYNSAPHLPALTFTFAGFVNGDSSAAVTGAPVLATSATATSPVGEYPITVAVGTLAAANYSFTTVNGTLTVTGGAPQTITFNALPTVTYGVATFNLAATATSGAAITYTVSGPAQLLGSAVTVTGVGTVIVTANQAGNDTYGPAAAVTQSFQVTPAVLTITAQPATRAYNAANPPFTFVASGFVSADNATVLTGAPAYATTATLTSPPGTYPLTISQGTLFASNYTFTFVNSTLTVTLAQQTITFPALASQTFGASVTLGATSSSGLPVSYTVTSPGTINGNVLVVPAPGTVTVTATQAGNGFYAPATPVTQTYVSLKSPSTVNAMSFTIPFGGALPVFTYTIGVSGFTLPTNEYSGLPSLTTPADSTSAPGTYPIVITAGTLTSNFYDFTFVNGTLTILPPSSFILTATPPSVTVPVGQARQVSILLTPVNDFIGSVTIGCSGLPAGVTCTSSPNTLTTVQGVDGVQPVTATLTISAGAPIASAQNRIGEPVIFAAGWFWLPSLLLGGLLAGQRKRLLSKMPNVQGLRLLLIACLLLGASSLVACGTSSGGSNSVKPGTTTIQVTGAGTSTSGTASATLSLSVTIQ